MKQAPAHRSTKTAQQAESQRSDGGARSMPPPPYGLGVVDARAPGEAAPLSLPANRAGTSLPSDLRSRFERSLGTDLGHVRVHTGDDDAAAARTAGALAFTKGSDIHFGGGQYDPASHRGRVLLAHEVAHTVQQQQGRAATVQAAGAAGRSSDALEHEADRAALRMVSGAPAQVSPAGSGTAVQYKKEVEIDGAGVFTPDRYEAVNDDMGNGLKKAGARMALVFQPDPSLDAEVVSLVQTTRSTVRNRTLTVPDQPRALFEERRSDEGVAIDQEVYPRDVGSTWDAPLQATVEELRAAYANNEDALTGDVARRGTDHERISTQLQTLEKCLLGRPGDKYAAARNNWMAMKTAATILQKYTTYAWVSDRATQLLEQLEDQTRGLNLDPRYTEQRTSEDAELTPALVSTVEGLSTVRGSFGWTARKSGDDWGFAVLRDEPGHTIDQSNVLEGEERFETAAMAEQDGQKRFIGSVCWGWRIKQRTVNESELHPEEIEQVSETASPSFYKAARKWNEMEVPDPKAPARLRSTLKLPTTD